jgi:rhodanese-related sulfurtransferase
VHSVSARVGRGPYKPAAFAWKAAACAVAGLVFAVGFWGAREVRSQLEAPPVPALVRMAHTIDGIRFVTADQAIAAAGALEAHPVFIDVRTSTEFSALHIRGAMNVQDFQIPDVVATLPADTAWVMYCTCPDDHLAKWAVSAVETTGVPNAVVLEHGLQAWQVAGGEVAVPDGADAAVQQGCGCSLGAAAIKLWAIEHYEGRSR